MPRRKENGRQSPRIARLQHDTPSDLFRKRLGSGYDLAAGSRELARRADRQRRAA